jgi:hypothetical protein
MKSAILPLLLALPAVSLSAVSLHVEGVTTSGFSFAGSIHSVTTKSLVLRPGETAGPERVAFPVRTLASVSISFPPGGGSAPLALLTPLRSLLPLTDPPTRQRMLDLLRGELQAETAEEVFAWAEALAGLPAPPATTREAQLLAADALARLGLWRETARRVETLNGRIPALAAPARLCRLNQRLAERRGDDATATWWARLPQLRIPDSFSPHPP